MRLRYGAANAAGCCRRIGYRRKDVYSRRHIGTQEAALEGFRNVEDENNGLPAGGVSDIQRLQMMTREAEMSAFQQ